MRKANKLTARGVETITKVGRHSDGAGLYLSVAKASSGGKVGPKSLLFLYRSPTMKQDRNGKQVGRVREM